MNGIHDMGGMHGFGPVIREENEPVFHEAWESRVLGLRSEVARKSRLKRPPGAFRDVIERIEPVRYLEMSYYERFLEVVVQQALEEGMLSRQELEQRIEALRAGSEPHVETPPDPEAVERVRLRLATQTHPSPEGSPPRFAAGDAVIARNLNSPGHNRLPRYIRGKRGIVERVNGFHPVEDAHAYALWPQPQCVYTVRFDGAEVWGPHCESNTSVYLELWEYYLEPAGTAQGGYE